MGVMELPHTHPPAPPTICPSFLSDDLVRHGSHMPAGAGVRSPCWKNDICSNKAKQNLIGWGETTKNYVQDEKQNED